MASVNGRLVSCDRCGEQVFLKCTGEGEADGGFTRWNNFESMPEGWGKVYVPSCADDDYIECMTTCPKCTAFWKSLLFGQFLKVTTVL